MNIKIYKSRQQFSIMEIRCSLQWTYVVHYNGHYVRNYRSQAQIDI